MLMRLAVSILMISLALRARELLPEDVSFLLVPLLFWIGLHRVVHIHTSGRCAKRLRRYSRYVG